jgi:heme A synthase
MDIQSDIAAARQRVSPQLKLLAVALRSVFLIALGALAVRVSLPQAESVWTIYDEPRDAVRLVLGFVVIAWIVYHLFRRPSDAQGYRTWVYLGTVLVPLTLAALAAFW